MGIHYFYTWLTNKYPLIKKEFKPLTVPQIDYLYLDLNGIIHKCAKDDSALFKDLLCGKRTEEIYVSIINYTNYVISLIKPRKGIMIAVDGVAPRAKMNNQRNRRFMASKTQRQVNDFLINTLKISPNIVYFKNNSISPGTEFMIELNRTINFFIRRKIHEDLDWRGLEVVFSGGDVPGEGEHKILNYIRQNRQTPEFNNQDTHCIYGNDSDLVLLSLITHLPNVMLLREEYQPPKRTVINSATKRSYELQKMEVIYINILREYFQVEFECVVRDNPSNIEHIIDDFVLFSFFIGNDFLHQVYCMNTKLGIFDEFIEVMLRFYQHHKRFLTNKSVINWQSFYMVLSEFLPLQKKMIKTTIADFNSRLSELHKHSFYSGLKKEQTQAKNKESDFKKPDKQTFDKKNPFEALAKANFKPGANQQGEASKGGPKSDLISGLITQLNLKDGNQQGEASKGGPKSDLISGLITQLNLKDGDDLIVDQKPLSSDPKPDMISGLMSMLNIKQGDDVLVGANGTNPDQLAGAMQQMSLKPSDQPPIGTNQPTDPSGPNQDDSSPPDTSDIDPNLIVTNEAEVILEDFPRRGQVTINEINEESFEEPEPLDESQVNAEVEQEMQEEESKKYLAEFRSQYTKLVKARDLMQSIYALIDKDGNYQEVYYKEYFGVEHDLPIEVSKICNNYLNGVDFVYKYYYCGCPSWSWYYEHHLSPLLFDLYDYLQKMFDNGQDIHFSYQPSIPTDPYVQLLYILPNESLCLLPPGLTTEALADNSPIKQYYPITYDITPFDKHKDYTWLAMIEHIDDHLMSDFIAKFDWKNKLSAEENFRNRRGDNYLFRYDPKCAVDVQSPVTGFETVSANISIVPYPIDSEFTSMPNLINYQDNHASGGSSGLSFGFKKDKNRKTSEGDNYGSNSQGNHGGNQGNFGNNQGSQGNYGGNQGSQGNYGNNQGNQGNNQGSQGSQGNNQGSQGNNQGSQGNNQGNQGNQGNNQGSQGNNQGGQSNNQKSTSHPDTDTFGSKPRAFPSMFFANHIEFNKTVRHFRYRYELNLSFKALDHMYQIFDQMSLDKEFADPRNPKDIFCDPITQQRFVFKKIEFIPFTDKNPEYKQLQDETLDYLSSVGIRVPYDALKALQKKYQRIPIVSIETPAFSSIEFTGLKLQKGHIKSGLENPVTMLFFAGAITRSFPKLKEFPSGSLKHNFQPQDVCLNISNGDLIRLTAVNSKNEIPKILDYEVISKNSSTKNINLKVHDEKLLLVDEKLIREFDLRVEHLKILWIALDSIKILCDHSSHSTLVLGDGFEIGLNFINFLNRRPEDWKMVADMVRIHLKLRHDPKKGPLRKNSTSQNECMFISTIENSKITKYYNVYLTVKGFNAVKEFFAENKPIVDYMKMHDKDLMFFDKKARVFRFKTQFNAYHLFRDMSNDDINIRLFQIYAGVLKKTHSTLMLLPSLGISFSIDVVNNQLANINLPKNNQKKQEINPIYLMRYAPHEDVIWPPFGTRPYYHEEGDRVAFINAQHSSIKFGVRGTVIGVYKDMIEVLFDESFIGATNLNGRCPNFRGKIVCVFDIFNLSKWNNIVVDFEDPPKNKKELWRGDFDFDGLLQLISEKQAMIWKHS